MITVDWTEQAAINKLDTDGRSTNTLTVEVGSDQVRFLVNDTEVATQPRSAVDTDGITGVRVNHLLDVHIDNFKLGMYADTGPVAASLLSGAGFSLRRELGSRAVWLWPVGP